MKSANGKDEENWDYEKIFVCYHCEKEIPKTEEIRSCRGCGTAFCGKFKCSDWICRSRPVCEACALDAIYQGSKKRLREHIKSLGSPFQCCGCGNRSYDKAYCCRDCDRIYCGQGECASYRLRAHRCNPCEKEEIARSAKIQRMFENIKDCK